MRGRGTDGVIIHLLTETHTVGTHSWLSLTSLIHTVGTVGSPRWTLCEAVNVNMCVVTQAPVTILACR